MTTLGPVHALGAPLTAEKVRDEIAGSIRSGACVPGQKPYLRDIADARQMRIHTLHQLVTSLEQDGLLTRRGDTATVVPLDMDIALRAFRLQRKIEAHVFSRACELISPATLNGQQALLDTAHRMPSFNSLVLVLHNIDVQLCQSGATAWDLRALWEIQQTTRRYVVLGQSAPGPAGPTFGADDDWRYGIARCQRTIDHLRAHAPQAVVSSRVRAQQRLKVLARLATERDFSRGRPATVVAGTLLRIPPRASW